MMPQQQKATDPHQSVFVTANAGTGKTTVLVNRVLRLLLGDNDQTGTAPHRILCITYTKAAAAEMASRIQDRLGQWATMPEAELQNTLTDLLDHRPDARLLDRARHLFALVLDVPGGLKIQTIHSFCQSVLARFPLEANIPPHFTALDDLAANDLLAECMDQVLKAQDPVTQFLTASLSRKALYESLKDILGKRSHFFDPARLKELLGLPDELNSESLWDMTCGDHALDREALQTAAAALAKGSAADQRRGALIAEWLLMDDAQRCREFDAYRFIFLTRDDEIRKASSLATKKVLERNPHVLDIMEREAARLLKLLDLHKSFQCYEISLALWEAASRIETLYEKRKRQNSQLDFDDMIILTLSLLSKPGIGPWVLYKLDGGIDHLLVDEAQDTSPMQWDILLRLTEEFFAGSGARDMVRTVFAVGDEKQSIYSFQGAQPEEFQKMRHYFQQKSAEANQAFQLVPLQRSFRSSAPVLQLVDRVFAEGRAARGVIFANDNHGPAPALHHEVNRVGTAGHVELWPLMAATKQNELTAWDLAESTARPANERLAEKIAAQIGSWLDRKERLPSENRTIQPGDILILVQRRTGNFVNAMIRALKTRGIMVAGADRLRLLDHIAVQDVCALLQFLLLPEDDLNLAAVLKSPFIGFTEQQLYDLAQRQNASLWDRLRDQPDNHSRSASAYLSDLLGQVDWLSAYDLVSDILNEPCPADRISGRHALVRRLGDDALDPLEEFMNTVLIFQRNHSEGVQGFLDYVQRVNPVIKRDSDVTAPKAVRIMTVHGAKGLEAPVVFLPDTTQSPSSPRGNGARVIWADKIPVALPVKSEQPAALHLLQDRKKQAEADESRRLLYVALTRARDRLYICGALEKPPEEIDEKLDPDSWYALAQKGFQRLDNVITQDDGALFLSQPQTAPPDIKRREEASRPVPPLPALAYQILPEEMPVPPRAIASRPQEEVTLTYLPLLDSAARYWRGTVIHRMLQILPDIPKSEWEKTGQRIIRSATVNLTDAQMALLLTESMAVLNNPEFGFLFEPPARSEVSVMAELDGQTVSGQIDRLKITDTDIWIIDYKTDRNPPQKLEDVPEAYISQLYTYKRMIARIYPGRQVHCALLWTDSPSIMLIPMEIL